MQTGFVSRGNLGIRSGKARCAGGHDDRAVDCPAQKKTPTMNSRVVQESSLRSGPVHSYLYGLRTWRYIRVRRTGGALRFSANVWWAHCRKQKRVYGCHRHSFPSSCNSARLGHRPHTMPKPLAVYDIHCGIDNQHRRWRWNHHPPRCRWDARCIATKRPRRLSGAPVREKVPDL